ncbi:MAG: hypothetical protein ACLU8D_08775 [Enterocloster sp.]
MKNLQYFPFERNRYYYGKLLTEQDFNSEQRYFNDKRRMVNRFLHGSGVAAGLTVVGSMKRAFHWRRTCPGWSRKGDRS